MRKQTDIKKKLGRPKGTKDKVKTEDKVPLIGPSDLIPRLPEEKELEYKRLIDFCIVPESKRNAEFLAKRWNITEKTAAEKLYRFKKRSEPWFSHLEMLVTEATLESYTEQGISLAEEHTRMWTKVREVGKRVIQRLLDDPNYMETVTPKDALAFIDASFKADRLLTGESTSNVSMNAMVLDTTSLSLEEKKQLRLLLMKTQTPSDKDSSS